VTAKSETDFPRIIDSHGWFEPMRRADLLIAGILADTDGPDYDALLERIEAEILSTPNRKQESMNRCLAAITLLPDNHDMFRASCASHQTVTRFSSERR
jgi:hypothetical protein